MLRPLDSWPMPKVDVICWNGTSGRLEGDRCRPRRSARRSPPRPASRPPRERWRSSTRSKAHGVRRYALAVPYTTDVRDAIVRVYGGRGLRRASTARIWASARTSTFAEIDLDDACVGLTRRRPPGRRGGRSDLHEPGSCAGGGGAGAAAREAGPRLAGRVAVAPVADARVADPDPRLGAGGLLARLRAKPRHPRTIRAGARVRASSLPRRSVQRGEHLLDVAVYRDLREHLLDVPSLPITTVVRSTPMYFLP